MSPTLYVSKMKLNQLPEDALQLIGMGQYTLYQVSMESIPEVKYALRTGPTDIFFLRENGEPLDISSTNDFDIQGRVDISDIDVYASTPNFCLKV